MLVDQKSDILCFCSHTLHGAGVRASDEDSITRYSHSTPTLWPTSSPSMVQSYVCDVEQTQPLCIPQSLPKHPVSLFQQCLMPLQMCSAPIWWCESGFLDTCHRARLEVDSGKAAACKGVAALMLLQVKVYWLTWSTMMRLLGAEMTRQLHWCCRKSVSQRQQSLAR